MNEIIRGLHTELRRLVYMLLIAPLSANSLVKITAGLSDSLLTSIVRAWDTTGGIRGSAKKRIIVAQLSIRPCGGIQLRRSKSGCWRRNGV